MSNQIFIPAFEGGDGGIIEKAFTIPQLRDAMDFCISMVTDSLATSISIQVAGRGKLVIEQYNGSAYSTSEYWMTEIGTNITITLSKGKNIKLYGYVTYFDPRSCKLTSLDVSKNVALTHLIFNRNQLKSLDVSKNVALTYLDCSGNQLTTFDISKNTALTYLDCNSNQLTTLDVSKNVALTYLDCNSNQLTTLDVSKNTALNELNCNTNPLWSHIGDVIAQLPKDTDDGALYTFCDGVGEEYNPEAIWCLTDEHVAALEAKGWHEENDY